MRIARPNAPGEPGPTVRPSSQAKLKKLGPQRGVHKKARERYEAMKHAILTRKAV